ncbi:hypothetical protein SAMN02927924_02800 [Sphingobium faniae]|nr:hypothetical protein SAMN02927924_02800 [Sphingobium faniae]
MRPFKHARDRNGDYQVDWSLLQETRGDEPPARIEFIPFSQGDARVPSLPADETMYCALGKGAMLTHAVIVLRIGTSAVHVAMSTGRLRHFADCLTKTADLIEAQPGWRP